MGWAWRSSESYGDKDEPENKPDTDDLGAKEPENDGTSKKSSWWDQFHGDSVEDDYYDWRGYQGPVTETEKYSYDRSIDDSDSRWYKKSSFRYGRYTDYSPSSLFRSAFYSPRTTSFGFSSEGNETKNKAIRALRTLGRNANTICDKDAKISYTVQYSTGVDANTFSENLIDGKTVNTIYVSPDSVVDAKTTEEEDAAVDALTGFVLLRVQIAQDFSSAVIEQVNSTALKTLPTKLMAAFASGTPSAANIAEQQVDECLAGMLSKGLLTRLARRRVVKDWGGFAPYFVRHAKKFTSVRERLESMEFSLESLVGQLTYNLVDDENVFDLGSEIDAIVTEHLGDEVAPENILNTCHALVIKLREYVKTKASEAGKENLDGPIEKDLREMLENFIEQHAEAAAVAQKEKEMATEMLNDFSGPLGEHFLQRQTESNQTDELLKDSYQLGNELLDAQSREQFINALKEMIKSIEATAAAMEASKEDPVSFEYHKSRAQYEQRNIAAKFSHFAGIAEEFKHDGVTEEFNPHKYATSIPEEFSDKLKEQINDLKNLSEQYQQVLKQKINEKRDKIADMLKQYIQNMENNKEVKNNLAQKAAEVARNIETKNSGKDALPAMKQIVREAQKFAGALTGDLASHAARQENAEQALDRLSRCRSINGIKSEYEKLVREAPDMPGLDLYNWQYSCDTEQMANFAQNIVRKLNNLASKENVNLSEEIRNTNWQQNAINKFLDELQNKDKNFEAHALSQTFQEVFKQLEELFGKGEVPNREDNVENEEKLQKLQNLAKALGFDDADKLLELFHGSKETPTSTLEQAGQEMGQKLCKILPLFDELNPTDSQLFGEVVEVSTKVLADSTKQVNDEARNDPEEEYVAYLNHSDAKPVVTVERPRVSNRARIEAQESKKRMKNAITRIHEALQFHNTKRTGDIYGTRSGDLDEGGLHKLGYDCEHIWSQKTIAQIPDVAVGILVDQSGSMCGGSKIFEAREMCIALAEAIKKVPGIHLHIYGHTANTSGMSDLTLFEHYSSMSDTGTAAADLSRLGTIDAIANNYDGYAIKETAKLLARDPAKRKYLFVIADGLPHGDGYCGTEAEKHVTSVCKFVRERLKIATYAFAVGVHGSYRGKFISQYGKDNVMFLTEVSACLPQITRFLRNTLQKEKTLVEIGS